jgi:signal transduction histidine kinase
VHVVELKSVVHITVANTGPGISPEYSARLFERFFRANPPSDVTGSGLGLSLARELARAHAGDLMLARADAEWTEFELTIPAANLRRGVEASACA